MESPRPPAGAVTSNRLLIGLVLAVSTVLVGTMLFVHFWDGVRFAILTRDPNAVSKLPVYVGFLSQMGIFFWSAAAAICFFSVTVLARHARHPELERYLVASGVLTLILAFDDAFQGHDAILPHFGVQQTGVLGVYAGLVVLYLIRFRRMILETGCVLLVVALSFFGLSMALDRLEPPGLDRYLFEDSAKLIGIVSWLAYFVHVGEYTMNLVAGSQVAAPGRRSA